jgi:hypothetical protein
MLEVHEHRVNRKKKRTSFLITHSFANKIICLSFVQLVVSSTANRIMVDSPSCGGNDQNMELLMAGFLLAEGIATPT